MSGRSSARWADRAGAPARRALPCSGQRSWAPPLVPGELCSLDERFGAIAFSVSHLGLFSSRGEFRRLDARLALDASHPERTRISVVVDTPWQEAAEMLRGPGFLDVQRHPDSARCGVRARMVIGTRRRAPTRRPIERTLLILVLNCNYSIA